MMKNGTKVFIAGSRRISRLNKQATHRIDNIIDQGFLILVGDANGIDKAVQQYLHNKGYSNVLVFCMEPGCRNNIGDWPTRRITAPDPTRHDFAHYSRKDRVMAEAADYGFMLWDGQSKGTLTNIVDLVRQGKPVLVHVPSRKATFTLRQSRDLEQMLGDSTTLRRIDRELEAEPRGHGRKASNALLF